MKRTFLTLILVPIVLATANDTSGGEEADAQKKIAHIQQLLEHTRIDTTAFPKEMPLGKFLAAVRRQLPGDKKIALRLEEKELGKEAARLADAPVRCSSLKKWPLGLILHKVVRQVTKDVELDYAIRDDAVVITRASLAANSFVYDVGDVIREMPSFDFEDLEATDNLGSLVNMLGGVELRPWEKIEVLNGTRLAVLASPDNHGQIADILASVRRMSDVAIVMNARLYEVDRGFFSKHITPLFAKDKEGKARSTIVAIEAPLLKRILQQKVLLESEEVKLRPSAKRTFLSRHSVFRFASGRDTDGFPRTGAGLTGVSFEVRPLASADRRYLCLHITQHVAQLVGIDKGKKRDAATGKDGEIESPNVRKSSLAGTIRIADTAPLLMPVAYRPQGKDADDRVWLLVARPFIWIEAEEKERGPGGQTTAKEIWNSGIPEEGSPPPKLDGSK